MKIVFASDHAGFEMKEYLIDAISTLGYEVKDFGPEEFNKADDYPDFVALAARAVSDDPKNIKAVVLGGSGQGEAMVANRFSNVRAVVYAGEICNNDLQELDILTLSRKHNDANILSLGARFITNEIAVEAVKKWLEASFGDEERHVRRIKKIESVTQK